MRPIAHADGSDRVWCLCELFPSLVSSFDDGVIRLEDTVGEPFCAHILPDVLHCVQAGGARRQEDRFHLQRHDELAGGMLSYSIHEQHSLRGLGDMTLDFVEM